MHIKRENNAMIMTERLVCTNYGDMKHLDKGFEKINDYEYKCKACGTAMRITRTPIIFLDDKGSLKVQVVTENPLTEDWYEVWIEGEVTYFRTIEEVVAQIKDASFCEIDGEALTSDLKHLKTYDRLKMFNGDIIVRHLDKKIHKL